MDKMMICKRYHLLILLIASGLVGGLFGGIASRFLHLGRALSMVSSVLASVGLFVVIVLAHDRLVRRRGELRSPETDDESR